MPAGEEVTVPVPGSLPNGGATNFTIVVTPTVEGLITNSLTVASPTPDPNPGNNTTISAGFVDGVDPPCDVIYFRIQKNDGSSRLLCLRADEAQILSWALSGVVWLWITSKEGVL